MDEVAIEVVQMRAEPFEPARNRMASIDLICSAFGRGADLVVLPELASTGYVLDGEALRATAERVDGETVDAWQQAAAAAGGIVVGGICERDGDALYNTSVAVGPDGLLLHYRKLHLFDREKQVFTRGDRGLPVADTAFGRLATCVCYDLRFVEVARVLALRGCDVIAVPTAWVAGFDADPTQGDTMIAQARGVVVQANLNQVAIACASQVGVSATHRFLGSSLIVDAYGACLGGPLGMTDEGRACATIDLAALAASRARSDLIRPRDDRRTDVYNVVYDDRPL
jgi:N-carbamoylputrescine amidase